MEELDRVKHEYRYAGTEFDMGVQRDRYFAALLIEWWIVPSYVFGLASAAFRLKPTLFRRDGWLCFEA